MAKAKPAKRKSPAKKKPVVVKEEMTTLWVVYSQSRSGGERCEGEDDGPYASHETTYVHTEFSCVFFGPDRPDVGWDMSVRDIEVPKEPFEASGPQKFAYVVVATHSDGDTFGSTSGEIFIEGVYGNAKKAAAIAEQIRTNTYQADAAGRHKTYLPWEGYFSSLESVAVKLLPLYPVGLYPETADLSVEDMSDW